MPPHQPSNSFYSNTVPVPLGQLVAFCRPGFPPTTLSRHRTASNVGLPKHAYSGTMTKKLLFVVTIALVFAFAAMAADVTGKWTFEQPGRGGGPGRPVTITLKQDGAKLTGSVPGFARGGGDAPPPTEITDGKVDGNNVSFTVKREMGGQTNVQK